MKVAVSCNENEKELEIVNKSKAYFVSKLKPLNENMKIRKTYLDKGEDYFYYAYLLKTINQYFITDIELSSDEYFINDDDVCELTETKEKEIANKYYNIVSHYEKKSFVEFSTKQEMKLGKYLYTTSGYDNDIYKDFYMSEFLVFNNLEEIYFSDMEFIVKTENGYYVPYYNYDLYLNDRFQIISCVENDTMSHIRLEKYLNRKINAFDDLEHIMLCKSEFMRNMIEEFKIKELQISLESCYITENNNFLYKKSLYKKDGTHIRKCSESEVLYLSKKLTKIDVPDINFETPIDFIYIDTVETNDNSNYVSGKSCNGGCYSLCEERHYFGRIKNNNLEIICLEENTSSSEFRMDYRGHYNNDVDVCEFVDADYSIYCSDNRTSASILQYADKCTIDDYLNDQDCEITSQFDEYGCFCSESEELYSNDLDNKKEKLKKLFPIFIID